MNSPKPLRFTREDYHRIGEAGLFDANLHVELIFGEIIQMSPKGVAHEACLRTLLRQLYSLVSEDYTIGCQAPIAIGDSSEPEPDVSIARGRESHFAGRHPHGNEVILAIEVSDSTLQFDKSTKATLYAEAQIANYWIFNLVEHCVEAYRNPIHKADGTWYYGEMRQYQPTAMISLPRCARDMNDSIEVDLCKIAF